MSSVNSMLYTVQNMAPALLNVGSGKSSGYDDLSALNSALLGTSDTSSSSPASNWALGTTASPTGDTVTLAYKSIGDKVVGDMAGVTAQAINDHPELDGDYLIALIDTGSGREARVYSRSDILNNFEGTEEEKKQLQAQLDENPLMVFKSGDGLPETTPSDGAQALAKNLNAFLTTNGKTLNSLDKAGYDPLANMLGSPSMKKMLAAYASPLLGADTDDE